MRTAMFAGSVDYLSCHFANSPRNRHAVLPQVIRQDVRFLVTLRTTQRDTDLLRRCKCSDDVTQTQQQPRHSPKERTRQHVQQVSVSSHTDDTLTSERTKQVASKSDIIIKPSNNSGRGESIMAWAKDQRFNLRQNVLLLLTSPFVSRLLCSCSWKI